MRSDPASMALPDGAGTILQVFRQTFASQSREDEVIVFYLRGQVAECILRTQFQDEQFRAERERIFREADAARPLIGYRESSVHVAALEWSGLSHGYDRDLYQEHKALIDKHRAQLGKEPSLIELVNREFNLGLNTPGLARMVSNGALAVDFSRACMGDISRKEFKDKYKGPAGEHLKALVRLATYTPQAPNGAA